MEGNFRGGLMYIAEQCNVDEQEEEKENLDLDYEKKTFDETSCENAIDVGINEAFKKDRGLNSITEVIRKAVSNKKNAGSPQ